MIKLLGITMLVGLATSVQTVVAGAAFVAIGGVAVVEVKTPDVNLFIPAPTHFADAGLMVARFAMPEHERAEVRRNLEPWLPMIESATRELADAPNGTMLVSVDTPEESVRIQKRHGRLTVDVDAPDAEVHVSIPARSVKRIARQLGMLI
jgi:hypothetical protein